MHLLLPFESDFRDRIPSHNLKKPINREDSGSRLSRLQDSVDESRTFVVVFGQDDVRGEGEVFDGFELGVVLLEKKRRMSGRRNKDRRKKKKQMESALASES